MKEAAEIMRQDTLNSRHSKSNSNALELFYVVSHFSHTMRKILTLLNIEYEQSDIVGLSGGHKIATYTYFNSSHEITERYLTYTVKHIVTYP